MPILFIHGVSVRKDEVYFASGKARRKMFEQYVLPVTKPRYPNFDVLEDLYWGDLGVRFRWDLSSMFGLEKAKAMGATGHVETTDPAAALFELISILSKDGTEPDPETLPETHDQVVLKAAREAPVDLIRAVVAPERCRFEPDLRTVAETKDMKVDDRQAAEQKGQVSALLLIAADAVAQRPEFLAKLKTSKTGKAALDAIDQAIVDELNTYEESAGAVADGKPYDEMGAKEIIKEASERLHALKDATVGAARYIAEKAGAGAFRARLYSAGALLNPSDPRLAPWLRNEVGPGAMLFFGDVFEYLRRGQSTGEKLGPIADRAAKGIQAAAQVAEKNNEPLVVVTHSFGSAIFYDLLTSSDLSDISVRLWVMAGAQVSLFAEMAVYRKNAEPTAGFLLKPAKVQKWLNFYDQADLFSYQAQPVFGNEAVTDIRMPGRNDILKAHSAYFTESFFYEKIADELREKAE